MSDLNDIPSPIKTKVEGVDYELKRLSNYNRVELLKMDRADKRRQLQANIKEAGVVDPEKIFGTLQDFDEQQPDIFDGWTAFANDPVNEYAIVLASLKKTLAPETAETVAKEVIIDMATKASVCGLTLITRGVESDEKNPTKPETIPLAYGQPDPSSVRDAVSSITGNKSPTP